MRRCALSSPPKILTGHLPPQCIWAVQMHSLTVPLKPTARSSHREVEYELFCRRRAKGVLAIQVIGRSPLEVLDNQVVPVPRPASTGVATCCSTEGATGGV